METNDTQKRGPELFPGPVLCCFQQIISLV